MSRIKQVIIIRRDLKMRRGKEIAQGSHASMEFLKELVLHGHPIDSEIREWLEDGNKKVTCYVQTIQELMDLHKHAKDLKLRSHFITDSGHTEFHLVPTVTALCIGPNISEDIDKVTGHLPLY